jgi:hypothetical protein
VRSAVFGAVPAWEIVAVRSRASPATPLAAAALARLRTAIKA